jgi:hypothetical protein
MTELLADPRARAELGAAGRSGYAAGYSWQSVAPRYLAAIRPFEETLPLAA